MIRFLRWSAAAVCFAGATASVICSLWLAGVELPIGRKLFGFSALDHICAEEISDCSPDDFRTYAMRAPLDDRALSGLLAGRYTSGLTESDGTLAELVLRRDPRSELARIVLAQQALEAGDRERFLSLYLPLFRTDPRQAQVYADTLARLSLDPSLFAEVSAYIMANRPDWGRSYLMALTTLDDISVQQKLPLYAEYPEVQSALLDRLISGGNLPGAYIAFSEMISSGADSSGEAPARLAVPFNATLLDQKAPAPFGWNLNRTAAEYLEEGGVYAFYQGRRRERILSQTFPLFRGNWRIAVRMSGYLSESGGRFRWTLSCAGGSAAIASYEVRDLGTVPSSHFFDVSLPSGACGFVTLTLEGVPGVFPQPARVEVKEVRVHRLPEEDRVQ